MKKSIALHYNVRYTMYIAISKRLYSINHKHNATRSNNAMYKLVIINAIYNVGADTDALEFDTFDELQDYVIEHDIEQYQIEGEG